MPVSVSVCVSVSVSAADVTLEAAERSIVQKIEEIAHLSGFRALRQTVFSEPSKARRFFNNFHLSYFLASLLHSTACMVYTVVRRVLGFW